MAALTEKMKTEQKDRLNKVIMRLRHVIIEAVDASEISKIEGVIAVEVLKEELIKAVMTPSKLPAPPKEERPRE